MGNVGVWMVVGDWDGRMLVIGYHILVSQIESVYDGVFNSNDLP